MSLTGKCVIDIFKELAKNFPQVTFSVEIMRIAVGTKTSFQPGTPINLYDLKSASMHSTCYVRTQTGPCKPQFRVTPGLLVLFRSPLVVNF